MEIIYSDKRIIVALKPSGVLSTDVPGGMPSVIREELGDSKSCVIPIHRLDAAVSGVMLFARSHKAAELLSRQISDRAFEKQYYAVVNGTLDENAGTMRDLLYYDRDKRKSLVVADDAPDVKEALLDYEVTGKRDNYSLLKITLHTGRTHQIRVQLSSRGYPIVGDKKYGNGESDCNIALWSHRIAFAHPETNERMEFSHNPPNEFPWNKFEFPWNKF